MTTTGAITGAILPVAGEDFDHVADMARMNLKHDNILVPRFDNASDRNASIVSPVIGMMCYLTQEGIYTYYDAVGAWRTFTGTTVINKGVLETLVSSTVMQPDDTLKFAVKPNSTYHFHLMLSSVGDSVPLSVIKTNWSFPVGATMGRKTCGMSNLSGATHVRTDTPAVFRSSAGGTEISYCTGTGGSYAFLEESGLVTTGTNGGIVQLNWAQATISAVPITVAPGSMLLVRKLR